MSALSGVTLTICYLSVAVTVVSLFLPQKRTRRIFSFIIGLFVMATLIAGFSKLSLDIDSFSIREPEIAIPSGEDYNELVKQKTAENLVSATDELLRSEGIEARDIRLSLKISDAGRIYVQEVVIYMSEDDFLRIGEVKRIIYRNLAKEPQVYVEKEVEDAAAE